MKKLNKTLALILCAMLAFGAAGCEKDSGTATGDEAESIVDSIVENAEDVVEDAVAGISGVANPMSEIESLEALNEAAGVNLVRPGVMGVTDEAFYTIAETPVLAQYKFNVNGVEYCFRAANGRTSDISGYYVGEGTAFGDEKAEGISLASSDNTQLARWFVGDVQYVLSATSAELDESTFLGIAEELASGTGYAAPADYSALIGDYDDSFSQRAVAAVAEAEEGGVIVSVHWSSSAFSYNQWVMNCTLSGNILSYDSCTLTVCDDDENYVETTLPGGFFTVEDGKLLWNGASEESCVDCVFVKNVG